MKIESSELKDAMKFAGAAVAGRAVMPILECVLMEFDASAGELVVRGTNLDMHAEARIPARGDEGEDGWSRAVAYGRLMAWLGGVKGDVEMGPEDEEHGVRLRARGGSSRATFSTLPAEEFPPAEWEWRDEEGVEEMVWEEGKVVAERMRAVAPAMSDDVSRHVLQGVYVHADGEGKVEMVATDGKRLHLAHAPAAEWKGAGVIVPAEAAGLLGQVLRAEGGARVRVRVREGKAMAVEAGGRRLLTKLIEGSYPNFRQVMPGKESVRGYMSGMDLRRVADGIEHAAVMTRGMDAGSVVLEVRPDGAVTVSARGRDGDEASEEAGAATVKWVGEELEKKGIRLRLNAEFAAEAFRAAGPEAEVWVRDAVSPMVVRNEGEGFEAVIMPMRDSG